MVYCGRSRGCYLCRKRKIKCDEALPECRNCLVYGRPCPGYRLESIFRNENYKVEQLAKKANSLATGSQRRRRQESFAPSLTTHQVADSTWEERAVCYFFDQYTSEEGDECVNYLAFLPSLYALCRENEPDSPTASCLRLAVEATALITLSNQIKAPPLFLRAREYYGNALRGLRQALASTSQAVKDETFASMVLLSLFEDIAGERNGLASSHAAGFELLMKMRGEGQLGHQQGRELFHFAYTHTHVEILALREKPRFDTDWIIGRLDGANPIQRLMLAASKISQLFLAISSLPQPLNADTADQLSLLILTGRQIDLDLAAWSQDLPEGWLPLVVYAQKTGDPLITYQHASIANVWIYYHAVRIIFHLIMLHLRRLLACATGNVPDCLGTATLAPVQKFISDICRSIPFCFGDVDTLGNPTGTFPSSSSEPSSSSIPERKRKPRARAFSVYAMIWPLWYVLSCGLASPEQDEQIRASLARIGSVLGIKLALVLAEDTSARAGHPAVSPWPLRADSMDIFNQPAR